MSAKIKHLLFDAANTLIHKPALWTEIQKVIISFGFNVSNEKLIYNHKFLSETITFPDRTNKDFYTHFNSELLASLGIEAKPEIVEQLFEKCSYLPWEAFIDCAILNSIDLPKSILSNFKSTLAESIKEKLTVRFQSIIDSETAGLRKPNIKFYELAVEKLGYQPNEILYIGDSLKLDYSPAKEAGINCLIIDRINFYPKHAYVINSFSEIKSHLI